MSASKRRAAPDAVVIDAGVGNLGNLRRALEHVAPGLPVQISDDPDAVAAGGILLLPGVGAFRPPRETLRGALEAALQSAVEGGAFLLGICVGFQLLFDESDEFGVTDGLGFLEGRVTSLPRTVSVPHIGWNRLEGCADHPLVEGDEGQYAYFVHSYAPYDVPPELRLASCRHGVSFPAVVGQGRVMGTQFHPEKSGELGLGILKNFLALSGVGLENRTEVSP